MTQVTPPYFFDEFLQTVKRKTPSARARALGFSVKDLDWLHTLYYATDAARQNEVVHGYPMKVERLLANAGGKPAIVLAGAFMMSPTPDASKAVLYSPYGGLELFDSRADLLIEVQERLAHPAKREELMQFVPVGVYHEDIGALSLVPLAGNVYPVKKAGEHWRISNGVQHGPYLQRNALGEWVLDLDRHHPRFGKTLSRYAGRLSTRAAEREAINIEAVGLREIAAVQLEGALYR